MFGRGSETSTQEGSQTSSGRFVNYVKTQPLRSGAGKGRTESSIGCRDLGNRREKEVAGKDRKLVKIGPSSRFATGSRLASPSCEKRKGSHFLGDLGRKGKPLYGGGGKNGHL